MNSFLRRLLANVVQSAFVSHRKLKTKLWSAHIENSRLCSVEKHKNQPRFANADEKILTGWRSWRNSFFLLFESIMGKKGGGGHYAVARGRTVGIYMTWDECKAQVDGFPNARYKKFGSSEEAQTFINENGAGATSSANKSTTSVFNNPSSTSSVKASKEPKSFETRLKQSGIALQKKAVWMAGSSFSTDGSLVNSLGKSGQKRDLSSLKVTEERVTNKRAKMDPTPPNKNADLGSFTVDNDGYVVVFTDGACAKNGKKAAKAGIGVWFGHHHPLNISEPVTGRQTNNTAEIQAAERAISQAKLNGINKLKLKTDSQFTINCVTKWLYNWKRNNWRLSSGGEVKNKEDLIKLDEAMRNMEIKWSYVAGHAGIEGNEAADRLAVAGAERAV